MTAVLFRALKPLLVGSLGLCFRQKLSPFLTGRNDRCLRGFLTRYLSGGVTPRFERRVRTGFALELAGNAKLLSSRLLA
jgi:hypothetical protein